MLDLVPDLIEEMKSDESESAPDILAVSSSIIVEIFSEYIDELPVYIRELTLENYFSEKATSRYAIKMIQNAWAINKKAFEISQKNNELRYNCGAVWETDRILKELPETLEAHKSREWLVMNLEEAKDFFGIDFKRSWLDNLIK